MQETMDQAGTLSKIPILFWTILSGNSYSSFQAKVNQFPYVVVPKISVGPGVLTLLITCEAPTKFPLCHKCSPRENHLHDGDEALGK